MSLGINIDDLIVGHGLSCKFYMWCWGQCFAVSQLVQQLVSGLMLCVTSLMDAGVYRVMSAIEWVLISPIC